MKIIVDENLPPALARALSALFAGEHEILHLRDRFGPSVKDVEWIPQLSREGNWIIISGDRGIRRKKAEYNAFKSSRLIGFFLSAGLNKAPLVKQTERILALWSGIETFAAGSRSGSMFELPMTSTRIGTL